MSYRLFPSPEAARTWLRAKGFFPCHRVDGLEVWRDDRSEERILVRQTTPGTTRWLWSEYIPADRRARKWEPELESADLPPPRRRRRKRRRDSST